MRDRIGAHGMHLTPGTRLGPYEIVALIGAGGMGEVYRARDTKLDRDVALKLLPDSFAADAERVRRFDREAKALASLNHSHIAQIYGLVDVGDRPALVMELVPGRTLDSVIQTAASRAGQGLPQSDAVAIAAQIAEALEAAHEAGIVHRDLKPANVMIRDDQVVKVLDFGLARAPDQSLSSAAAASSPTMLSPAVTGHGVILGTAGYMSPEQAKGRTADKRADIWSFGVVLFEMLAGRPLYGGETVTEVIAAVIKDTPNLDALPPSTPAPLRRLLERCLERDPRLRLRDIGEARIALARMNETADLPAPDPARRSRPTSRLLAFVGGALAVIAAVLVAWLLKPSVAGPIRRMELPRAIASASAWALSPDGNRIAYASRSHLYVHSLETGTATDAGAISADPGEVFWSPDGRTIGINSESAIRTIPASGGAFFTVCAVPGSGRVMRAMWQPDNTILFSVWRDSLYRVAASGGTPQLHVPLDPATEIDFHSFIPLPDGRLALTAHLRGSDRAQLFLVADGRREPVNGGLDVNSVRLGSPGRLLFLRVGANPGVWATALTGSAFDLSKASPLEPGAVEFDAASDSLMAIFPANDRRELVWLSRAGVASTIPGAPFDTSTGDIALSPDGRRAVLAIRGPSLTGYFVVRDLATGADIRVPAPQAPSMMLNGSGTVSWTPTQRLLYATGGIESWHLYDWPSDGSTGSRVLADGLAGKLTRDGSELFYLHDERGTYRLLQAAVQHDGTLAEAKPVFSDADMRVRGFDVSPDGRLLAFTTQNNDTQLLNVIVTTLPDLRERRQVTTFGRNRPVFSRDGRELYFLSEERADGTSGGRLNIVSLTASPFIVGAPASLFAVGATGGPSISGFDLSTDGRLLMTRSAPPLEGDEQRAVLRQNWMAALAR
jgi:serine/threonine protein kinase